MRQQSKFELLKTLAGMKSYEPVSVIEGGEVVGHIFKKIVKWVESSINKNTSKPRGIQDMSIIIHTDHTQTLKVTENSNEISRNGGNFGDQCQTLMMQKPADSRDVHSILKTGCANI